MLEPRRYPRIVGRALMLEPEAFERLAEDDAPVAEGIFLVALIGLLVGVAQSIGAFLYSWSMPPAAALEAIYARLARALDSLGFANADATLDLWQIHRWSTGYDTGVAALYPLLWEPFFLIALWLVAGLLLYLFARALGGAGTLTAGLGAAALVAAPHILRVTELAPFLTVPTALTAAWGTLMLYRAAQVAYGLSWRKAAVAALLATALLWVVGLLAAGFGLWLARAVLA